MLGEGDFVGRVLASAEETMEIRYALESRGLDLDRVAYRVSEVLGVKPEEVWPLSLHMLPSTKSECITDGLVYRLHGMCWQDE